MRRASAYAFALSAILALHTRQAEGASSVVLACEREGDGALVRVERRVSAELRAAGFVVEGRDADAAFDARRAIAGGEPVDSPQGAERPFAAVLLRRAPAGTAAEVWVTDRVTGRALAHRFDADRSEASEGLLAMRVVELMRAGLTDPPPPRPTPSRPVVPQAAPTPAPPAPRKPASVELGAGLAALYGPDFNVAWGPMLHASIAPCTTCRVRLLAAGPTYGANAEAREGKATLRQELAIAEATFEPFGGFLARPFIGAGVGAYHLQARGEAGAPFVGAHDSAWSALAAVTAGARLRLTPSLSASLGARAFVPFPRPVLDFAGNHAAAAGRPSWLFTLSLDANLGAL